MEDQAQLNVWVEASIKASMDAVKETKGIPLAAQMRFALLEWLETQGESPMKLRRPK